MNSSLGKNRLLRGCQLGQDSNGYGYADVHFIPEKVDIFLGTVQVAAAGEGLLFDEAEAKAVLMKRKFR